MAPMPEPGVVFSDGACPFSSGAWKEPSYAFAELNYDELPQSF
jgi:NADH:ubiquinone oxidoreductase subunit B-like Fe-S oxidoreductase